MGLDYSIRTYVRKEKLPQCLQWLCANSQEENNTAIKIAVANEILKINGHFSLLNGNQKIEANQVITDFKRISFSTSLIFGIDPDIIASLASWDAEYRMPDSLEDFKANFAAAYLGDCRIGIGLFDSTITRLKHHEVYEIDLRAVTTEMSQMLERSLSVKKWILAFSKAAGSIMTYIDLEHNGRRILFYNGREIEVIIKKGIEYDSFHFVQDLLKDYNELEVDIIRSAG